tara:strand:- start:342 stop:698 length:357 start_codon:yes stop_codon:yes gene_type:complete
MARLITDRGTVNNYRDDAMKAWVNVSSGSSSTTIDKSLGVSSITRDSSGQFQVNLNTGAVASADYAVAGTGQQASEDVFCARPNGSYPQTTAEVTILFQNHAGTRVDASEWSCMIIGG